MHKNTSVKMCWTHTIRRPSAFCVGPVGGLHHLFCRNFAARVMGYLPDACAYRLVHPYSQNEKNEFEHLNKYNEPINSPRYSETICQICFPLSSITIIRWSRRCIAPSTFLVNRSTNSSTTPLIFAMSASSCDLLLDMMPL